MSRTPEYLEAAADRVMIKDLLARYAWEVDHGTPEGFASVFTSEGIFEVSALQLRVQGTKRLTEFARSLQQTLPNVHHVMSNFVIEISGDRARGICELNEFMARPEAIYPSVQGWYEDDYVLLDGGWKLEHRRVFISEPASAVAGKVGEHSSAFFEECLKYQQK